MSNAAAEVKPPVRAKVTPNLPVNYDEELAAEALKMRGRISAPSGDLIRVNKDKTFELPSGDVTPTLDVIVAAFVSMNQMYEGKYDPKSPVPPVCMAIGTEIADMKPYPKAPKVQSKDGCAPCWANQWKSARIGGNGKQCKNQKMLALLGTSAEMQGEGPLMILKVSPTGTRFWDNYVTQVLNEVGALIKVVTRISFDPNPDVEYPSMRFLMLEPNLEYKVAFGRRGPALERLLVEPDFAPTVVADKPETKAA